MQQAGSHAAVADLGGSIITGIDGNPLAVLSSQLGIPMHTIGPDCDLLLPDGSKASKAIDNQVRCYEHAASSLSLSTSSSSSFSPTSSSSSSI